MTEAWIGSFFFAWLYVVFCITAVVMGVYAAKDACFRGYRVPQAILLLVMATVTIGCGLMVAVCISEAIRGTS